MDTKKTNMENKETTEIKERKRKTWEELTFQDDYMFKRVICFNKRQKR